MCIMSYYTLPQLEKQNSITSIKKEIHSFLRRFLATHMKIIFDLTFRPKQDTFDNVIK